MSRQRQPVAEIGHEDYYIVRHTHDIELATQLMRIEMIDTWGCAGDGSNYCANLRDHNCPHYPDKRIGKPVQVWVRIVPALPNSWAAAEGLRYTFNPAEPHSPGAFPAVEFR